mgnify:CR=1 FL=1
MTNRSLRTTLATCLAFGALSTAALAETPAPAAAKTLTLAADHGSRNTLLLASAIVLGVGLLDDNRTLTVLGGVGVLVSLYQSGQMGYRQSTMSLAGSGNWSMGLRSNVRELNFQTPNRPAPFVQWSKKF